MLKGIGSLVLSPTVEINLIQVPLSQNSCVAEFVLRQEAEFKRSNALINNVVQPHEVGRNTEATILDLKFEYQDWNVLQLVFDSFEQFPDTDVPIAVVLCGTVPPSGVLDLTTLTSQTLTYPTNPTAYSFSRCESLVETGLATGLESERLFSFDSGSDSITFDTSLEGTLVSVHTFISASQSFIGCDKFQKATSLSFCGEVFYTKEETEIFRVDIRKMKQITPPAITLNGQTPVIEISYLCLIDSSTNDVRPFKIWRQQSSGAAGPPEPPPPPHEGTTVMYFKLDGDITLPGFAITEGNSYYDLKNYASPITYTGFQYPFTIYGISYRSEPYVAYVSGQGESTAPAQTAITHNNPYPVPSAGWSSGHTIARATIPQSVVTEDRTMPLNRAFTIAWWGTVNGRTEINFYPGNTSSFGGGVGVTGRLTLYADDSYPSSDNAQFIWQSANNYRGGGSFIESHSVSKLTNPTYFPGIDDLRNKLNHFTFKWVPNETNTNVTTSMYVNGVLLGSKTVTFGVPPDNSGGRYYWNNLAFFMGTTGNGCDQPSPSSYTSYVVPPTGRFDEMCLWNRSLTDPSVATVAETFPVKSVTPTFATQFPNAGVSCVPP